MRIGLDGLVGLIPGIGDTITSALSLLILAEAIQLRVRKRTLAAIAANIALDWVVGLVPVVGDVFDIVYKANTRNVVLLEAELAARRHGGDVAMHERPSKRVKNVAQRRGFATN